MNKEIQILEQLKNILIKKLAAYPEGTLIVGQSNGSLQYRLKLNGKETYISKTDTSLIKGLAQKDYELKVLKQCEKRLAWLKKEIKHPGKQWLIEIYQELTPARQELIEPYQIPDDVYAKQWALQQFEPNTYEEGHKKFKTQRGESVRSKSEVIIANTLLFLGIPYFYEKPLKLKSGRTVYPDFTFLHVSDRKEYILEHLGMLDVDEYRNNAFIKIERYAESGFCLGNNLLITMEDSQNHLNSEYVLKLLKKYR